MGELDKELGNNPLQIRSRSYSVGQMPPSLRAGVVRPGGGRLRSRLEASSVGLEELMFLRQTQRSVVEQAKAMLMANVPLEDIREASVLEEKEGDQQNKTPGKRRRASSMDVAEARTLALKAKKAVEAKGGEDCCREPPSVYETIPEHGEGVPAMRDRSVSFTSHHLRGSSSGPDRPQRHLALRKAGSMSALHATYRHSHLPHALETCRKPDGDAPAGHTESGRDDRHGRSTQTSGPDISCSGNATDIDDVGKLPAGPSSEVDGQLNTVTKMGNLGLNLSQAESMESLLAESSFSSEFTTPRSMAGSNLKYSFPSPMHAILLHYHKADDKVILKGSSHKDNGERNGFKETQRRASFGDTFGRPNFTKRGSGLRTEKTDLLTNNNSYSISSYMEMLVNKGLSKKRQEEQQKRQSLISALEDLESSFISNSNNGTCHNDSKEKTGAILTSDINIKEEECGTLKLRRAKSESTPSVAECLATDLDSSSQWDDSGLSSSGKKGSRVSIRSSTSSKASLSSEEGYYSHPGSPQHKHSNNRFSIQSSASFNSAGSLSFVPSEYSDEDAMIESPSSDAAMNHHVSEVSKVLPDDPVDDVLGAVQIIQLSSSPGCRRRCPSFSTDDDHDIVPSDASKKQPQQNDYGKTRLKTNTALNDSSSPQCPIEKQSPNALVEREGNNDKVHSDSPCNSPESCVVPKTIHKMKSPEPCHSPRLAAPSDAPTSPSRRKYPDSTSWGKILPDAPRMPSRRQTSPRQDCPQTPTIIEESPQEVNSDERHSASLLPTDGSFVKSPQMCEAPKIPSWRRQRTSPSSKETDSVKSATSEATNRGQEGRSPSVSSDVAPTTVCQGTSEARTPKYTNNASLQREFTLPLKCQPFNRERLQQGIEVHKLLKNSPIDKQCSSPTLRKDYSEPLHTKQTGQGDSIKSNSNCITTTAGSVIKLRGRSNTPNLIPHQSNVFQYPPEEGSLESQPKAPSLKNIPDILKSWMEARTPTLPKSGSPESAESKSATLPRGARVLVTASMETKDYPNVVTASMETKDYPNALQRAKRMFHSQEIYPNREGRLSVKGALGTTNTRNVQERMKRQDFQVGQSLSQGLPSQIGAFSRPRAQSWSRGGNPLTLKPPRKTSWAKEGFSPSRIGLSSCKPICGQSMNVAKQTHMHWYRPSAEIQDTFV